MKPARQFAVCLSLAMLCFGVPVAVHAQQSAQDTPERIKAIDAQLQKNEWEAARRLARDLMETLAEGSGGSTADHRAENAVAEESSPADAIMLGRAASLRAVAEAALNRLDAARWNWYLAQNLDREAAKTDLSRYPKAAGFLTKHLLREPAAQHANLVDVYDPVRPEKDVGGKFAEPLRLRSVYPYMPRDLLNRDRFSHVVFIQITVGTDGQITQPLVVDGGRYPGMIYRAFDALREWRYKPATVDGNAVPYRFVVAVAFANDRAILPLAEWGAALPSFNVLATGYALDNAASISVDRTSNALYIADAGSDRVLRVNANASGASRAAGTGEAGYNGDAASALDAQLHDPSAMSFDVRTGELFIADTRNYRVRVLSPRDHSLKTVAGVGLQGVDPRRVPYEVRSTAALAVGKFSGDGGPAADAAINLPSGVCADPFGVLFISDSGNHRIRAVNRGTSPITVWGIEIAPGHIKTVAGTGVMGFSGDGGKATLAALAFPGKLKIDAAGNLLVVDTFNQRIRRIDRHTGLIRTVARGGAADITADRSVDSWSQSLVGVGVTDTQHIVFADRSTKTIRSVSPAGEESVIYSAGSREGDYADINVGAHGEIYVLERNRIGVLQLEPSKVLTYFGGSVKPLPKRALVNASAGR
jgi:hypothetical protein